MTREQDKKMPKFQVSLAPQTLWQAINPWSFAQRDVRFGLVNIDLGSTPAPAIEQAILDRVGSYGRQLGRIGDALEVLLRHVRLEGLTGAERDAITILQGQLAEIRQVRHGPPAG